MEMKEYSTIVATLNQIVYLEAAVAARNEL